MNFLKKAEYEPEEEGCEADALKIFLKNLRNFPPLTLEEEKILGERLSNRDTRDASAKKLIDGCLRLVVWRAKKYLGRTPYLEFNDLIQEGVIGLVKAVEVYDYKKGSISNFVVRWVDIFIRDAIRRNRGLVSVSASARRVLLKEISIK